MFEDLELHNCIEKYNKNPLFKNVSLVLRYLSKESLYLYDI